MHGTPPAHNPEELARRLFVVDGEAYTSAKKLTMAAVQIYEQLRTHLSAFLGSTGFDALWTRSLYLVQQTTLWDDIPVVLQPQPSQHHLEAMVRERSVPEVYNLLLAIFTQFLATLFTFIGADLGFRLLQQRWPALSLPTAHNQNEIVQR